MLVASIALLGDTNVNQPIQNINAHGQFVIAHVPSDDLNGQTLSKCEYGDGTKCLFMNRERVNHPLRLKFRIDHSNVSLESAVAEAEYIAWLQMNSNACHYADNDSYVRFLAKASVRAGYVGVRNPQGVVFDAHRIEMDSSLITNQLGGKAVDVTQWQICVGIDPKHGAIIELDKHPVGGLLFNIGTRLPDAPRLAGVKGLHEKISATVLLPAVLRDNIAAIGLRAIPTRLATVQTYEPSQDPNAPLPVPTYACPDWSDYHGLAVVTNIDQEIRPADRRWDASIDNDDDMMHFAVKLVTPPDEPHIVCSYARDKVNNVSAFSTPIVAQSYRATDMFTAMPEALRLHMGHGCSNIDLSPWQGAAAACAWALAHLRLRRRGCKTQA